MNKKKPALVRKRVSFLWRKLFFDGSISRLRSGPGIGCMGLLGSCVLECQHFTLKFHVASD